MNDIKLTITIIRPTEEKPKGYIGLVMSNLEPLPGETWTRGCDCADGPHTEETLQKVIADIRSYVEMGLRSDMEEP
jgi:hypothetical protein